MPIFDDSNTILSSVLLMFTHFTIIAQNKETALTQAAYKGHIEIACMLIEAGANINLQDQVLFLLCLSFILYLLILFMRASMFMALGHKLYCERILWANYI